MFKERVEISESTPPELLSVRAAVNVVKSAMEKMVRKGVFAGFHWFDFGLSRQCDETLENPSVQLTSVHPILRVPLHTQKIRVSHVLDRLDYPIVAGCRNTKFLAKLINCLMVA